MKSKTVFQQEMKFEYIGFREPDLAELFTVSVSVLSSDPDAHILVTSIREDVPGIRQAQAPLGPRQLRALAKSLEAAACFLENREQMREAAE